MVENQNYSEKDIRHNALNFLARREHSTKELQMKLERQGFDPELIAIEIQSLQDQSWQSDERFAASFVRLRQQQNKGPLRIKQELIERGLSELLIQSVMNERDEIWLELAKKIREKKYAD